MNKGWDVREHEEKVGRLHSRVFRLRRDMGRVDQAAREGLDYLCCTSLYHVEPIRDLIAELNDAIKSMTEVRQIADEICRSITDELKDG